MLNRKGQNIAEYSILIALVVAAAVAMQVYVRRGIQGRIADAVDHAPDTEVVGGEGISFTTKQYEPYYLDSSADISSKRDYQEKVAERGDVSRTGIDEESRRKAGAYEKMEWESDTAR